MVRHSRSLVACAAVSLLAVGCDKEEGTPFHLLTVSVPQAERLLERGGTATVSVWARTVSADGLSVTPAQGTVALSVDRNGSIDPEQLTLDAEGKGEATFNLCSEDDEGCVGDARAVVTGSITLGGQARTSSVTFTVKRQDEEVSCEQPAASAHCTLSRCAGSMCTAGGIGGVCRVGACDTGTAVIDDLVLSVELLAPNGEVTMPRLPVGSPPVRARASVRRGQNPAANMEVLFSIDKPIAAFSTDGQSAGTPGAPLTVATDAAGFSRAYLHPGDDPANGLLRIEIPDEGLVVRIPLDVTIPGSLVFAPKAEDPYFRVMGVRTSGWREQNVLRFALLDSTGQPYTGEGTIAFEVSPLSGVTISPQTTSLSPEGDALVTVFSGTGAGTVAVTATATIGTRTITTTGESIAIVGAKASGREIAVNCELDAVPALLGNTCRTMREDYHVTCTAVIGDRFKNTIGRDVRVHWSTEGGLFGPASMTPMANPDANPAEQDTLGRSDNTLRTLNTNAPRAVDPIPGEPFEVATSDWRCHTGVPHTFNPRNGLNTILVHTRGEEGFIDLNNNGEYDEGEYFFDQGEPYVDANDNNQWDEGEEYFDVNGNGQYDGPNGVWDADTTVWASGHILFTGQQVPDWDPELLPAAPPGGPITFTIWWADENLNSPAAEATVYSMSMMGGAGTVVQTTPVSWADNCISCNTLHVLNDEICDDQTRICRVDNRVWFPPGYSRGRPQSGRYTAPTNPPFGGIIQAQAQQDSIVVFTSNSVPAPIIEDEE